MLRVRGYLCLCLGQLVSSLSCLKFIVHPSLRTRVGVRISWKGVVTGYLEAESSGVSPSGKGWAIQHVLPKEGRHSKLSLQFLMQSHLH